MNYHDSTASENRDKIAKIQRQLDELSAPPHHIENTVFEIIPAVCGKHGSLEQRVRRMTVGNTGLSTKSECEEYLRERLVKLKSDIDAVKQAIDANTFPMRPVYLKEKIPVRFAP